MTSALAIVVLLAAASAGQSEYERANELFRTGRYDEASQALSRALALYPNLVPALTLQGKLAVGLNHFDEARQAFTRAVELQPSSAYTQFLLGFYYYVDNDFRRALALCLQNTRNGL